jgi:hypothetical protein
MECRLSATENLIALQLVELALHLPRFAAGRERADSHRPHGDAGARTMMPRSKRKPRI